MTEAEIVEPIMDISEIIRIAVKASKEYDQKQRIQEIKTKQNKRLRNTRLLLKHYSNFKDHIDEAIYKGYSLNFDDNENLDKVISINSIKDSISRTHVILTHVKAMLDLYQSNCDKAGPLEQRKLRGLKYYYFEQMKLADIAIKEEVDERTCLRDIRAAEDKMCAYIFGIDGIDMMSE